MNISCDLDGVIIDHQKNKIRLLKKRGFNLSEAQTSRDYIKKLLPQKEYEQFQEELYGALSTHADTVTGAGGALKKLAQHGHELQIITRRWPRSRQFIVQWLQHHNLRSLFPDTRLHLVTTYKEKDTICKLHGIQMHIDDTLEVLQALTIPTHKVFFGRHATPHPSVTMVVKTWSDLYKNIRKL